MITRHTDLDFVNTVSVGIILGGQVFVEIKWLRTKHTSLHKQHRPTEVWYNTGNPDFPLERINQAFDVLKKGEAGRIILEVHPHSV